MVRTYPNAPTLGADAAPEISAWAAIVAATAGLGALPFGAGPAFRALAAASADPWTGVVLQTVLLVALVAAAVTSLFGIACGLGRLLDAPVA